MRDDDELATLSSTIIKGVESRLKDLHTSMPGIIDSFDPVTQLARVQPAIKRVFKIGNADGSEMLIPEALPLLINVPVQFPRAGGFCLTFPVKQGDECLLIFSERSIDNWYTFGGVKNPGSRRFHSLSDAIAILGVSSKFNAISSFDNTNVQLKKEDGAVSITVKEDGTLELEASNTKVIGDLEVTGATVLSATVTSNGKDISDTHSHVGSPSAPTGGVSNTGTPI